MTSLVSSPYGVWLGVKALPEPASELHTLAAEVEGLGYSALWLGGSWGSDLSIPEELLAGSTDLVVGTSIANIWRDPATEVAGAYTKLAQTYGDRFVLGLGPGHHTQTQWTKDQYRRPLARLAEFLDVLDSASPPVPVAQRALSALGPKALELAAERSAGALPYLTTPEHTAQAREIVGPGVFLAPEQKIVLETDPAAARALARTSLKYYLGLPNYVNAWRRLGFAESDFEGEGSDKMVDALFGWGEDPLATVRGHLEAGADHVCVQPVFGPGTAPIEPLREIAAKLF